MTSDVIHLRDGRSAEVREATVRDADGVAALFAGLPQEDIVSRFGHARRPPDRGESALMVENGPHGRAVVAVAGAEADRIVALARYERRPGAPEAELAVAVARPWQHGGVGTGLLEQLLVRAAADGIDALWAAVEPPGYAMLRLLRSLGSPRTEETGLGLHLVRIGTRADDRLLDASAARLEDAARVSLEPLFRPRSIAVVGASRDPDTPGGGSFRALRESGFPGPIYAVNRAATEIAGHRSSPSLALLPESPDLVVVAVPAADAAAVAREAVVCGARAIVVLSAWSGGQGSEGAALQAQLRHIARTCGVRIVGPNCLGMAVCAGDRPFDASFARRMASPGRIALATQSGGVALGALAHCAARGIGLSSFVSLGNQADVAPTDLLAWWSSDGVSRVVLLYLEGLEDVGRLAHVARRVAVRIPIIALKGGRTGTAQRAASSHTAALATGAAVSSAALELGRIVEVTSAEELFDAGALIAMQPLPNGPRVVVVSNAGGPAILAADACEAAGLVLPELDPEVQERVAGRSPLVSTTRNPIDLGAGADGAQFAQAIEAVLAADAADAVIVIHTATRAAASSRVAAAVEELAGRGLPIIGCSFGERPTSGATGVPWVDFPERAARALGHAWRARQLASMAPDPALPLDDCDPDAGRRALLSAAPGAWLDPTSVDALLRAYGIPVAAMRVAGTPEEAAAAQRELGGPVAVKLLSAEISHKTDVGGVVLGPATPDEAAAAFRAIAGSLASHELQDAMDGVVVQSLAGDGIDLIVGALDDRVVGPVVMVGLGGIHAEILGDRRVALAPLGPRAARDLWSQLKGSRLLDGPRGTLAVDREALADIALRVGRLAAEQPLLAELDLNPVRALPGGGVLVLDARCRRSL